MDEELLVELFDKKPDVAGSTVQDYIDLTRDLPLPTARQKSNFSDFVAHGHSWYKHLPLVPPGVPFYFFLDPSAGMDLVRTKKGEWEARKRWESGFHYSEIPTEEYREKFGYLAYSADAGTTVVSNTEDVVVRRDYMAVTMTANGKTVGLPEEFLEAGIAELTGIIHTAVHGMLPQILPRRERREVEVWPWPEESGGKAAWIQIVDRCIEVRKEWRERTDVREQGKEPEM